MPDTRVHTVLFYTGSSRTDKINQSMVKEIRKIVAHRERQLARTTFLK